MITKETLANAIRALSMDAVELAKSGHPGMPMGMADIAVALFHDVGLKCNPTNPKFFDRDRFVLSNGHGSMLLYSLLHLLGYDLGIEDLKKFRQLHSRTPGHPEYGYAPGVETTTGPLGQGIANAVGMALAETLLAKEFNKPGHSIVNHHTFAFAGDGCLMEGVSHEACALAGAWKLSKLIVLYDDNGISIDGKIQPWMPEDVAKRFEAYGWQVFKVDGHNVDEVAEAIKKAKKSTEKPSLIACKTIIGKGSPNKAGTHDCHGAPLGASEIEAARKALNWNHPPFEIPGEVKSAWDKTKEGEAFEKAWTKNFDDYAKNYPELAKEFLRRMKGEKSSQFDQAFKSALTDVLAKKETIASRKASQNAISALAPSMPELVGGSADLTGSNLTNWKDSKPMRLGEGGLSGNHINYGVREFGMSAIMNGLALHGGLRPFGGTFLMFSGYALNALRMSSIMKLPVTYVYTHDSIGLGEDGPTHQPVEQMTTLRVIPRMETWRPADTVETLFAWKAALVSIDHPVSLVLSRQNLPFVERNEEALANIERGGYIVKSGAKPKAVLIATGSELSIALSAHAKLKEEGIDTQVVSLPSTSRFDQQDAQYQEKVIPSSLPAFAIEAGTTEYFYKYVGRNGGVIGMSSFGESAPANELYEHFGITDKALVNLVKSKL